MCYLFEDCLSDRSISRYPFSLRVSLLNFCFTPSRGVLPICGLRSPIIIVFLPFFVVPRKSCRFS